MISQLLRTLVLFSFLFIKVHGRPRQQRAPKTMFSVRRPVKSTITKTSQGVRSNDQDTLLVGVKQQNYLKQIDVLGTLDNGLKRRETSPDEFPKGKIQKLLFKSKSTSRLDADARASAGSIARCGVEDTHSEKESQWSHFAKRLPSKIRRRFRRYVTQGSKWPNYKTTLKWTVKPGRWSSQMSSNDVKNTLTKAFRAWAEVSPLVFRWEPTSAADITIEFVKGYHTGCSKAFDGPGGVLAHAYYPQYSGDIHFDDDEKWLPETDNAKYKSLLKIATHEIGHSLGLKHSSVKGSIMNPYYVSSLTTRLGIDDIQGIQSIYGQCEPNKISSIEGSALYGRTYIFKDSSYWKYDDLNNQVVWPGYPQTITNGWNGIPSKIDEMLLWRYKVYFFVGNQYYLFNEYTDKVSNGYPKLISQGWVGVPDDIDAAFSPNYDTSYFFKGDLCYTFNNINDRVEKIEKISVRWPGVPDNIDSAFVWLYNGFTYFFKGKYFYRWDDSKRHALGPYRLKKSWRNICEV